MLDQLAVSLLYDFFLRPNDQFIEFNNRLGVSYTLKKKKNIGQPGALLRFFFCVINETTPPFYYIMFFSL